MNPTKSEQPAHQENRDVTFAHNLEIAAWHVATYGVQKIEDICLLQIDDCIQFTCFLKSSHQIDTDRYLADRKDPEQFRRDVKAGLKQLTAYLNWALENSHRSSALNREGAHV